MQDIFWILMRFFRAQPNGLSGGANYYLWRDEYNFSVLKSYFVLKIDVLGK